MARLQFKQPPFTTQVKKSNGQWMTKPGRLRYQKNTAATSEQSNTDSPVKNRICF